MGPSSPLHPHLRGRMPLFAFLLLSASRQTKPSPIFASEASLIHLLPLRTMTRSLSTIREQLTQLESHTQDLYRQLCHSYLHYLQLLDHQINRQLVLAVHHICTQLYPSEFLELSPKEHQHLQQETRQLGAQFQSRFFSQLQRHGLEMEGATLNELPAPAGAEDLILGEEEQIEASFTIQKYLDTREEEAQEGEIDSVTEGAAEALLSKITAMASSGELMEMLLGSSERPSRPRWNYPLGHPETLANWGSMVEESLEQVLEEISLAANQILQRARIIPHPLPAKVLEIALQAEENGAITHRGKLPHVLTLFIEMTQLSETVPNQEEGEDSPPAEAHKQSKVLKVVAIRLKLNELEFQDAALVASRKQLRQLAEHLKKLHKHHQHLHQEQQIIAAEHAWRASWQDA